MEMRGLSKPIINSVLWKACLYLVSPAIFSVVDDPGKTVLEIGSGAGYTTDRILKRYAGTKIFAVDYDIDMIRKLEGKFKNQYGERIEAEVGDATNLKFENDFFDSIFAFETLHHIKEWETAVREMHRVLKPGGRVFIWDWDKKVEGNFIMRWLDKPEALFSKKEVATVFEKSGFKVEEVKSALPLAINIRARKI